MIATTPQEPPINGLWRHFGADPGIVEMIRRSRLETSEGVGAAGAAFVGPRMILGRGGGRGKRRTTAISLIFPPLRSSAVLSINTQLSVNSATFQSITLKTSFSRRSNRMPLAGRTPAVSYEPCAPPAALSRVPRSSELSRHPGFETGSPRYRPVRGFRETVLDNYPTEVRSAPYR